MKDIIIDDLIYEDDRPAHIAKHDVTIDEVIEVLLGDYVYIKQPSKRLMLVGITANDKYLTIILGERPKANSYGLITAWSASRQERRFYNEYVTKLGGEKNED